MREPTRTNLPPRIGVVACGGTIASTGTSGAATPRLGATDLLDAAPWLAELARLDARTFMTKASPDVTLDDVTRLCAELLEFRESAGLDGLVVTHGTDTLEEVAFALDLLWPVDVPLVVTGAMRNASMPGADGPANLTAAIAVAGASSARGQGVLVVLNDQVHAARYVRKGHTSSVATFVSPTVGPVGYLAEGVPVLPFTLPRPFVLDTLPPTPLTARVALLTVGIGDDGGLLPAVRDGGYAGLVVAGFGGGHVPAPFAESPALVELLARAPVVLASRANAGEPLRATYGGFSGSETALAARGLIGSGLLDAPKARVLLTLLLSIGASDEQIRGAFDAYSARS